MSEAKNVLTDLLGEKGFPEHRVVGMGWHCFSYHCKYSKWAKDRKYCAKRGAGFCEQGNCPVFENAKGVEQFGSVRAKPIEWQHHIGRNGQQWWEDQRYGFHIDFDAGEYPAYCYAANWGAEGHDTFETLKEAQEWCQAQANRLVDDWAVVIA